MEHESIKINEVTTGKGGGLVKEGGFMGGLSNLHRAQKYGAKE